MASLILVVDDNADVTQVVSAILNYRGYETMTASDGGQALRLMEERRPSLILCDILMPGMDGFQVFRKVRADRRWRAIPFAFLTALSDLPTRSSSSEMGVEAFVTKPFRSQELLAVVAGLLRRSEELQDYSESELESFKSQLLFMITHELNTPLSVIRMLTDTMRHNLKRLRQDQLAEYLDLLAGSTVELSSIVDSMLLAIQIDSGKAQTLYEAWAGPQQLHVVLESVIEKLRPKAIERKVVVDLVLPDRPLTVQAHKEQLVQILTRVLDNAVRFSPVGERVAIKLESESGWAVISITDRGPGMTPDEVQAAFDRLRQINRARQEQQGVGLSLSLVQSLVKIHGGELKVQSAPGLGSTFSIRLPLVDAAV
jgi:two-component system, sensor histidine kinase and response regulator